MTIEVTLDEALETRISAEAKTRGISMGEYVHELLMEKAQSGIRKLVEDRRIPERRLTIQEFLDGMAYHGPIPEEMRTQEITREFIYGDHP